MTTHKNAEEDTCKTRSKI